MRCVFEPKDNTHPTRHFNKKVFFYNGFLKTGLVLGVWMNFNIFYVHEERPVARLTDRTSEQTRWHLLVT